MQTPSHRVRIERRGSIGILTLDRERALNAIDVGMVRDLTAVLRRWEHDDAVRAVVLRGAGERGLCAGGDVRSLYGLIVGGRPEQIEVFFRAEYALTMMIAHYRHPIVVFADGLTMGGGIGLAGHASHRVVTQTSELAMPETRLGMTPDVGGSLLFARAPGRIGEFLSLTSASVGAADAIEIGLADRFIRRELLDVVVERLASGGDPAVVLAEVAADPGAGELDSHRGWIDAAFAQPTVPDILAVLDRRPEPAAHDAALQLRTHSPTALAVTLESIRRARSLPDLRAALTQEFGLVMWFGLTQPDVPEGIRAQVIEKDRLPRWSPADTAGLDPGLVEAAFTHRPAVPLRL